jgi:hypothetical protein
MWRPIIQLHHRRFSSFASAASQRCAVEARGLRYTEALGKPAGRLEIMALKSCKHWQ